MLPLLQEGPQRLELEQEWIAGSPAAGVWGRAALRTEGTDPVKLAVEKQPEALDLG
jgi:hypothetical protein